MSPVTYLKISITTLVVTLFLFFLSAYISMRLGAIPWPIVFSIVVSAGLLREVRDLTPDTTCFRFAVDVAYGEPHRVSEGGEVSLAD
ncbi:unnamed protein product [marine sediment metagenome]|uniref:Uncharacterized protein n=1 Tax=marine sediment metagenome TaxID=412755 RepID=X0XGL1_9ZZZZ